MQKNSRKLNLQINQNKLKQSYEMCIIFANCSSSQRPTQGRGEAGTLVNALKMCEISQVNVK